MRAAINLRVEEGWHIAKCCREAGISQAGWYKAMKRREVREYLDAQISTYVQGIERIKGRHRARAIEIGAELMEHATSEAVRARMVEFFAREPEQKASVNVAIQNNIAMKSGAYEFAPPGARVVEVQADDGADQRQQRAHDSTSVGPDPEDAEIIDEC